ncbi:MAG: RNA 3'-terminal phosphate cyclase [Steroidobacter sp.]
MIDIDGSQGEGGGQILRSSLSLSICTEQPLHITNIRANRDPPGLKRQHLTAVKAAAEICDAEVAGAEVGSRELTFKPGKLRPTDYSFAIGTAGSSTLVLQTVLPPLLHANAPSTVRISGGTHNRGAPPFDFLQRAFIPLIERMGPNVALDLVNYGFYPRGGGVIRASITPVSRLLPLELHTRGPLAAAFAEAYIAGLPLHVAHRELEVVRSALQWNADQLHVRALPSDMGAGNALTITIAHEHVTEVFTGFGERGLRAEDVAEAPARAAHEYLSRSAPVDEHLADQLLLPLALAGSGSFTTTTVSDHLRSNAIVIERFTGRRVVTEATPAGHRVEIR